MGFYKKKKEDVIPQVRTITRYGTGSVILFNYAKSPISTKRRFRINELTSNVPYAVRSVLRNDLTPKKLKNENRM